MNLNLASNRTRKYVIFGNQNLNNYETTDKNRTCFLSDYFGKKRYFEFYDLKKLDKFWTILKFLYSSSEIITCKIQNGQYWMQIE